jgi:hypothetical protein
VSLQAANEDEWGILSPETKADEIAVMKAVMKPSSSCGSSHLEYRSRRDRRQRQGGVQQMSTLHINRWGWRGQVLVQSSSRVGKAELKDFLDWCARVNWYLGCFVDVVVLVGVFSKGFRTSRAKDDN